MKNPLSNVFSNWRGGNKPANPPQNAQGQKMPTQDEINHVVQMAFKHKGNPTIKAALKDIAEKDPVNLFVSLFRQQRSLFKKEIADFQAARAQAISIINPNRYNLYQFYQDLQADPFVYGIYWNKRVLKISNKKGKIRSRKTKIQDDVKTAYLEKAWFNQFVKQSMQSIFWGHSLVYAHKWKDGEIAGVKTVYREHVKPEINHIVKTPFDLTGFDYTQPPFSTYMISVGDPEDLGLFERAGIMFILKKHSWANWDEFEEIFGIPIRIAKTATQDARVRAEMEETLAQMGSAAWGVLPLDSEIDIKENSKQDAFKVFNEKRKAANEEIEILFTGQKRETQDKGTYGKEKAQLQESNEVVQDDLKFIASLVNDSLIPMLRLNGYPFTDDDEFVWDDTEVLSQTAKAEIYDKVNTWGFELDQKDVEGTFGVKIVGKKAPPVPVIPPAGDPDPDDDPADEPDDKDKDKPEPDDKLEAALKPIVEMHKLINQLYHNV